MKKSLRMVFLDNQGDRHSISIPEVKDAITKESITTLAGSIVTNNVFGDEIRELVRPIEAIVTTKDTVTIKL